MTAPASAGFKLKDADGNEKIDLGFRLQVLGIGTQSDLNGDGKWDNVEDFRIRRARFRLKGTVNEHFGMFFQTDVSGIDILMIDAYVHLTHKPWLQAFAGQHLAPSNRQAITSSGTLLAADRPNITYKALTWGVRALNAFSTATNSDTDLGLRGTAQVRDTGVTLFGTGDVGEKGHVKYHVGVYDGIQAPGKNDQRVAGRLQFNLGDSEASFYSTATYLGKKKTVAIGASVDFQPNVGRALTDSTVFQANYTYFNVDLFAEQPLGGGSLTFEGAYYNLDLEQMAPRLEGDGFYVQAGYLIKNEKWQPWGLFESWKSEDPLDEGSFDSFRVGLSYFMAGHNANVKVGYESLMSKTNIGSTTEDTISTFLVGLYTTY
jgi:hypothetical protein